MWSDFPKELLALIDNSIDTRTDLIRVRAICSSWRSSLPPLPNNSLSFPIRLPPIFPPKILPLPGFFTITESTIYHLESGNEIPNAWTSSSSQGWLIMVEKTRSNSMRLLDPLSRTRIRRLPKSFPKVLNSLTFRVYEIGKVYSLRYIGVRNERATIKKVVMSSSPVSVHVPIDRAIMAIYSSGKLGYLNLGHKRWTTIHDAQPFDDIVYHRGQFYCVNYEGRVLVIDSPSQISEIASPSYGVQYGGKIKHLVESTGDLFLVDSYLNPSGECYVNENGQDPEGNDLDFRYCGNPDYPVCFKVYKLNHWKKEWVRVKSLGGRALFVGDGCSFSIPAQDLAGCKENCIYFREIFFTERHGDHPGYGAGIFELENGTVGPLSSFAGYSHIFWPPPTWLKGKGVLNAEYGELSCFEDWHEEMYLEILL